MKYMRALLVFIIIAMVVFLLFLVFTHVNARAWDRTYGGSDNDILKSATKTGDGGYAMVGETYSFGAGNADFWLVKTDSAGNMEWDRAYGGTDWDCAYSVIQTVGGGYAVAGGAYSFGAGETDFWLVKTDGNGNVELNQTYGGTEWDCAWSVIQTSDGGYAIAGHTGSFGAGSTDFWLIKTVAHSASLPVPFWEQWWFWVIYGGVPSVFAGWYVIRTRRDYVTRGLRKIFRSGEQREDIDRLLFDYIKMHKGKIRISKCAKELGITEAEVKEAISRLRKDGLIEM